MTANTIISNSSRRKRSNFPFLSFLNVICFGILDSKSPWLAMTYSLHGSVCGQVNLVIGYHPATLPSRITTITYSYSFCANRTQNMTRTYANQWTTPYLTVSTVRGSQHIRRSSGIRASNYCVELNFTILCVRLTGCKPMEECILHLKELQSLHHKLLWNPFGCFPAHGSEFCTSEGSDNFSGCSCFRSKTKHFQKTSHCYASVLFLQKCLMLSPVWIRFLDETKKTTLNKGSGLCQLLALASAHCHPPKSFSDGLLRCTLAQKLVSC